MFSLSAASFVPKETPNQMQVNTCGAFHMHDHEPVNDVMTKEQRLFKTELCNNWVESGFCRYGDYCLYAHGQEELVMREEVRKKKNCKSFFKDGYCPYGLRC